MIPKTAIIVGASRGIGAEIARLLAQGGTKLFAIGRDDVALAHLAGEYPGQIQTAVHDVTNIDVIPSLFVELTGRLGGLDAIVYCAGVMPGVDLDEYSMEKDAEMIATNFTGAVAWLNEAAARFQNTGHGTIVAISSVAGERGRRGQPAYNASKAGLSTYMEALRNRLSTHGVTVTTIKPGPVATDMTKGLNLKNAMPVTIAAERIIKSMGRGGDVYLKLSHRVIFAVIRLLPSWVFRRLRL